MRHFCCLITATVLPVTTHATGDQTASSGVMLNLMVRPGLVAIRDRKPCFS